MTAMECKMQIAGPEKEPAIYGCMVDSLLYYLAVVERDEGFLRRLTEQLVQIFCAAIPYRV